MKTKPVKSCWIVASLVLGACGDMEYVEFEKDKQGIVNGVPVTSESPFIRLTGSGTCSGVARSEHCVLTANHCIGLGRYQIVRARTSPTMPGDSGDFSAVNVFSRIVAAALNPFTQRRIYLFADGRGSEGRSTMLDYYDSFTVNYPPGKNPARIVAAAYDRNATLYIWFSDGTGIYGTARNPTQGSFNYQVAPGKSYTDVVGVTWNKNQSPTNNQTYTYYRDGTRSAGWPPHAFTNLASIGNGAVFNHLLGSRLADSLGVSWERVGGWHSVFHQNEAPESDWQSITLETLHQRITPGGRLQDSGNDLAVLLTSPSKPDWNTPSATYGSDFPTLYNGSDAGLNGRTLTCYGYGANSYNPVQGGGLLRRGQVIVNSVDSEKILVGPGPSGQIMGPGDSGGGCFLVDGANKHTLVGIISRAGPTSSTLVRPSQNIRTWFNLFGTM